MSSCARIVSGEMHYARIPRAYWRARLDMARAMGLDAISTYVFWNLHEPQPRRYDFSGERDVAAYVREAAAAGLSVILRPGPYVCAEWDFGGLPAWLLDGRAIALRSTDPAFLEPAGQWLERLGEELAPLQRSRGGPIVAVQLENEYGAYGDDAAYLRALRALLDRAGFANAPYFTIDQPADLARGALEGVPAAATFAAGNARAELAALGAFRPGAPPLCGEFWAGWFDHWGEPSVRRDDGAQARDLELMLRDGASVNVYMFHGGTNFGFSNGANASDGAPYQPTTTSYDYQAALDEAGRPTPKYFAFRDAIARATGANPPPVPAPPATIDVAEFALDECAPLHSALGDVIRSERPLPMERFGQSFGYALYRTALPRAGEGVLDAGEPRDFIVALVDGAVAGTLDRRLGERTLRLTVPRAGATLELLVENGGRINYGPKLSGETKGLLAPVAFDGEELTDWEIVPLPLDGRERPVFRSGTGLAPAFYRGRFEIARPADTFLDAGSLGKGALFVNGHCAGRYWSIGPQRSLYVPGTWLQRSNEVVVFDVLGPQRMFIRGTREPIL